MKENFNYFWKFLMFWEKEYAGDINDGAGITIYGFTERFHPELVKELKELYLSGRKDVAEVKAKEFTKKLYWDALDCDNLEHKLDIVIADCAFNQGKSIAKEVKRKTLEDYIAFLKEEDYLVRHLWLIALIKRSDYYDELRSYDKFGRGWSKRIISLYDYLLTDYKELKWD